MNAKEIEQQIKRLASMLPDAKYTAFNKRMLKGHQLKKMGVYELNGKQVIETDDYIHAIPVKLSINHKRRLRKAYQTNGMNGVSAYMAKYGFTNKHQSNA